MTPIHLAAAGTSAAWPPSHRPSQAWLSCTLTLSSLNNLASTYRDLEQFDKALPLLEQVVKLRKATLGPDHPATLTSQNNLALAYDAAGQLEQAVPLFEQTLELRRARLGVDHPATLTSMNNLALGYRNSGQIDKALPLFELTLQLRIAKLGADQPATLTSMGNLARTYRDVEQFDKAIPLYQQAIELGAARLGTDHPMTLMNMNNLAAAYRAAGQLDKALPLMEQTLDLKRKKFGPEHPETLNGMTNLAAVYWSAGSLDRSVPLFEAALAIEEKSLGRKHPTTQMTIANLGVNYVDSGKIEEGISLLEEAMKSSKERPDLAAWVREQLADAYIKGKRTESFQSLANDFITSARIQFPEGSLELAAALVSTADQYLRLAMFRPAADLLREGTAIRNQHTADAWNTFNAQSMWGGALLGLAQLEQDEIEKTRLLAEAEPLLVAGYEGMKQRESIIPREAAGRITDALDRLIEFYTLSERPDEVTKYRDLRSLAPANPADSTQ